MLPIDYHVQNTLYKFNREMKRLDQGGTVPSLPGQPSKDGLDVDRPEMVKRITHKRPSKHTALNGSLTRRGVLFAKATLSSSLSIEEKFYRLSIGTWIPYRHL
jgi:hypothetical protein